MSKPIITEAMQAPFNAIAEGAMEPDSYWRGWNAAFDDETWNETAPVDWKQGYREARAHQAADEAELAR